MKIKFIPIVSLLMTLLTTPIWAQSGKYDPTDIPQQNWIDLERMLRYVGYPTGIVDGIMDIQTAHAMNRFLDETNQPTTGPSGEVEFTTEHYLALFELASQVRSGEVIELRPNWKFYSSDINNALFRLGCMDNYVSGASHEARRANTSTGLRCYKISQNITPVTPTTIGIDLRKMILASSDGVKIDPRFFSEAKNLTLAARTVEVPTEFTKLKTSFSSGMYSEVYSNISSPPLRCQDPEVRIFMLDSAFPPDRGVIDSTLIQIEREFLSSTSCPVFKEFLITLIASGEEVMRHKHVMIASDSDRRIPERFRSAGRELNAAWQSVYDGTSREVNEEIDMDTFIAGLRRSKVIASIFDGTYPNESSTRDIRYSMIFAWQDYIQYFDDYCLKGKMPNATSDEKLQLLIQEAVFSASVYSTSTNTRTGVSKEEWRVHMQPKYTSLYLALANQEILPDLQYRFSNDYFAIRDDIKEIIEYFRCTRPELDQFEKYLTMAALWPFDWEPPKLED